MKYCPVCVVVTVIFVEAEHPGESTRQVELAATCCKSRWPASQHTTTVTAVNVDL